MINRLTQLRALTSACLLSAALSASHAAEAPAALAPRAILSTMEKVADWQLAHPTSYPLDDWTEGVGDTGFMALAGISGSDKYREAMREAGEKLHWKLGPSLYHADDQVVGQMYAELYQTTRDPRMIARVRAQFDAILAEPRAGSLEWSVPDVLHRWAWCDSLFMGPGTWARLASVTGDQRYLDFAIERWWKTSDYLYDQQEHLYFRDSRYFSKREANGAKVFWGRGNGWVMGGLVRLLQYLPEHRPERARFVQQYREMAERVLAVQQADGLWRASLLDPASYASRETSGSALFTYALAWGVNQGLLPPERYAGAVKRAWQALASHVKGDGKLVHVQPIGADPKHFDPESSDVFAVGAFLLAGGEMYRMGVVESGAPTTVVVTNESATARLDEAVELAVGNTDVAVMDGSTSRILPTHLVGKRLLVRTDLAPGESRRLLLIPRKQLPQSARAAEPSVRAEAPIKVTVVR